MKNNKSICRHRRKTGEEKRGVFQTEGKAGGVTMHGMLSQHQKYNCDLNISTRTVTADGVG